MDPFALNGRSLDTDLLIFRSLFAIDPVTNLPVNSNFVLTTDGRGGLNWQDTFLNMSTTSQISGGGIGYLPSTINNFTNSITTIQTLINTAGIPGSISGPQLYSTVAGLGTYGYFSTLSIQSTLAGLGTYGYVSTAGLQSYVASTMNAIYMPTSLSTHIGLGTYGYISSLSLQSTVVGLSNAKYITYSNLVSTITSLGSYGYISSLSAQSTFTSVRSLAAVAVQSTVLGLGNAGYVSSTQLQSTVVNLLRTIEVTTAANVYVSNGAQITITNLGTLAYTSNFYNSTITYRGINGLTTASTVGLDFYFSSAALQLKPFSNYITPTTQITADIYPNFTFCYMQNQNGAGAKSFTLSTFLTYEGTPLLKTTNNSLFVATSFAPTAGAVNLGIVGLSNCYQVPMRMRFDGTQITGNYDEDYVLTHRLVNAKSYGITPGFLNSNIQVYMASTNSVFLTMQNTLV